MADEPTKEERLTDAMLTLADRVTWYDEPSRDAFETSVREAYGTQLDTGDTGDDAFVERTQVQSDPAERTYSQTEVDKLIAERNAAAERRIATGQSTPAPAVSAPSGSPTDQPATESDVAIDNAGLGTPQAIDVEPGGTVIDTGSQRDVGAVVGDDDTTPAQTSDRETSQDAEIADLRRRLDEAERQRDAAQAGAEPGL